jgi:hypothetical protein
MRFLRRLSPLAVLLILSATGCRSRVINVRLVNDSAQPISVIIIDYPGATFGVNTLAPGKSFQYRFQPSENGALKIQFTNAQGVIHKITGPTVQRNQEGRMEIRFTQETAAVESPRE